MSRFTKAERKKAKLRLGLVGVSGCGKTYSALRIATGMRGRIAVIDTEHDSASLYATEFDFDSINLNDHSPESYIKAINDAIAEGFDIAIIDSLSHVWAWCKAEVDRLSDTIFKGNSWGAWSRVTPRYESLLRCIIQSDIHVIATMRSKTETAQVEINGKKKIVKLGMKTEMKDGSEYEFTTVIDIDHTTNGASVSKDRTHVFMGKENMLLSEDVGKELMNWLMQGESPYVDSDQLQTLNDQYAKIHDQRARSKISLSYPNLSMVLKNDFQSILKKLDVLIDWQAKQPASQEPASQEQSMQEQATQDWEREYASQHQEQAA